jgi:hypothetical protein
MSGTFIILVPDTLYPDFGVKSGHFYNTVPECDCIDANLEPYNGGKVFSQKASDAIWSKINSN